MTLTEFLLARIAEDESAGTRPVLRELLSCPVCGEHVVTYVTPATIDGWKPNRPDRCEPCGHELTTDQAAGCFFPATDARVLRKCKADRRIVEHCRGGDWTDPKNHFLGEPGEDAPGDILALLALPYADHPDYQQEWKP